MRAHAQTDRHTVTICVIMLSGAPRAECVELVVRGKYITVCHRSLPVKSLIRNGVISGMGCQVRVRYMRRVWCAVAGEGVGGYGKYCKCSSGE